MMRRAIISGLDPDYLGGSIGRGGEFFTEPSLTYRASGGDAHGDGHAQHGDRDRAVQRWSNTPGRTGCTDRRKG